MKKFIRVLVPIILTLAILASCGWYLFSYDQVFTRDILIDVARFCQGYGYYSAATWFYDVAYSQIGEDASVAIELAEQYKEIGNYTKAEFTLRNAISDSASAELYIALCKTFVEQDKLLDAVNMLNNITDPTVKQQLEELRPTAPSSSRASGRYNQLIDVAFTSSTGELYVSSNSEYPSVNKDKYNDPISLVEGENNLYAVAIADNGLVSPVSVFSYTVGGIIRPVTFADAAVEEAVRDMLLIRKPSVVHTNDLWRIKEFTIPVGTNDYSDVALMTYLEKLTIENANGSQIRHITGLAELTDLKITMCSMSSSDLTAITKLPRLKSLTLDNCALSSVNFLSNAINLEYLDLSNNVIRNLEPIGKLTKLKELHLAHNALDNLSGLSPLRSLKTLDVQYNTLTNIDDVISMTGLTSLNADHNAITQIQNIGSLTSLNVLSLNENKITNISPVAGCRKLEELYISNNTISDISALGNLNTLLYLDFSNNNVSVIPTWNKSCSLVKINGANNRIKSLEPLSGLRNLGFIEMEYNKDISSVDDLTKCPVLIEVNVYGTKVRDVTALTDLEIEVSYTPV